MAETIVFELLTKLVKHVNNEANLFKAVRGEVADLEGELKWMQAFLKDADFNRKNNGLIQLWVKDIRKLCFKAEDVIDEFIYTEVMLQKRTSSWNLFHRTASFIDQWKARHRASNEIKRITAGLSKIMERRSVYGVTASSESKRDSYSLRWRRPPISSFDEATPLVGVHRRVDKVVNMLSQDKNRRRSVLTIVGIGGLGKTTLAWNAFKKLEEGKEFDEQAQIWISVTREYSGPSILMKVLEKLMSRGCSKTEFEVEEEGLNEKIRSQLENKRYLIILDDVWCEQVWEHVKEALPDRKNGSWVIITTRFLNVARSADPTMEPYELDLLDQDESLQLLLLRASSYDDDHVTKTLPHDLLAVAGQLAERCGGLPLALEVLGNRLRIKERDLGTWSQVLQTLEWREGSVDGAGKCMSVLASSYWDLPNKLKPCFLYMAGFSKIDGDKLIRLWVAEGFVAEHGERALTMEEIAAEYLEELVQRSMIQAIEREHDGSVRTCGVHDVLRELAISEAEDVGFLMNVALTNPVKNSITRRLIVRGGEKFPTCNNLRSLFIEGSCFFDFKLLKVLDISYGDDCEIRKFPNEIGTMINLRYLRITALFLNELPSSIGNLQFLQTLDVKNTCIVKLPSTIWKILTLRHILLSLYAEPIRLPLESEAKLTDLQRLDCLINPVIVPAGRSLPMLQKVELSTYDIHGDGISTSELTTFTFDFLVGLPKLTSLTLRSEHNFYLETKDFPFHHTLRTLEVWGRWGKPLGQYEFPPWLTELTLGSCYFFEDPMPTLEKLQNLRELKLHWNVFEGEKMTCSSGGFPQLRSLIIMHERLERWVAEAGAMPKLRQLIINCCECLKLIPDLQHLSKLRVLNLSYLPELDVDKDKLQHIPRVNIVEFKTDLGLLPNLTPRAKWYGERSHFGRIYAM